MNKTPCPCGEPLCSGVNDGGYHQCGGPAEACKIPGCRECGTPLGETIESLRTDLSASRRESAALGAMVARLRDALEPIGKLEPTFSFPTGAGGVADHPSERECHFCGFETFRDKEPHGDTCLWNAIDAALALTPATVGAEYQALVELEHAIGEVRRYWGSAIGATEGQRAVIDALAKLESTRALLSDRAPGKGNDK